MAVDLQAFAYSFSHGIIKFDDVQYTGISNISGDQAVDRSAVYGTGRAPQAKSAGQIGLGEGSVTFSDLKEGFQFYEALAAAAKNAAVAVFSCAYGLEKDQGAVISFGMLGCSLTSLSFDHENGADALGVEFPFDFLRLKVNGKEFAT